MSAHDDRVPDDELTRRYHEANAQDMHRPGAHVRQAVQAHAQAVLDARAESQSITQPESRDAANQPRWKISMLASIALAGLTGLLVLQFDRGTPEEKELALGQPRATAPALQKPSSPAVQEAAPAPPPQTPARPQTSARKSASVLKTPEPDTQPQPERKDAESRTESKAAPAQGSLSRTPQASPGQESAGAMPSPFPASPPAAAMQASPAMADRAMRAPMPSPAAPAPVTEARPQAARPQAGLAAAPRARAETSSFVDNKAALLDAARNGHSADIAQLVRQGASLNATDDAGRTPLMLAVINGHEAAVQQLLALGADRSAADREGLTALAHARRLGMGRITALIEAAR